MTDHPITPPPELVQQWMGIYFGTTVTGEVSEFELALATQAARWGADQELDACCELVRDSDGYDAALGLRAERRPKPPSLKEQALALVDRHEEGYWRASSVDWSTIRRALEQLDG